MNISELLAKLALAPYVEVVVARLPKWFVGSEGKTSGHSLFQGFDRLRQGASLRFVHQEVDVLGHDHVSIDAELIGFADPFQCGNECYARFLGDEFRLAVIAAEREEVKLIRFLEMFQSPWHGDTVSLEQPRSL